MRYSFPLYTHCLLVCRVRYEFSDTQNTQTIQVDWYFNFEYVVCKFLDIMAGSLVSLGKIWWKPSGASCNFDKVQTPLISFRWFSSTMKLDLCARGYLWLTVWRDLGSYCKCTAVARNLDQHCHARTESLQRPFHRLSICHCSCSCQMAAAAPATASPKW